MCKVKLLVFTAQRYANVGYAIYAIVACLSVCLFVCHKSVFYYMHWLYG